MNDIVSNDKIEIYHRVTSEEMEMNVHFHNTYEMIFVLKGKAVFKINDREYEVSPGSIMFISNLEKHELKVTEYPYERYLLMVNPDYFLSVIKSPILSSIFRHRPEHFSHLLKIRGGKDTEVESYLNQMFQEITNKEEHFELSVTSLLSLLFIHLYRSYTSFFPMAAMNRTTAMVLEIQKYIDENSQENLNLNDIAKKYFIDMYYLSRIFKGVTGYNFKEYVILQRISRAKNLLFYTNEDIANVALHSGFNNTNHFIKLFKKYEEVTPYQYRKKTAKYKKETAEN